MNKGFLKSSSYTKGANTRGRSNDDSTSSMGVASKGSDIVGDSISAPSHSMLQDDGNSQGGTNEVEKVGLGDDDSLPQRGATGHLEQSLSSGDLNVNLSKGDGVLMGLLVLT